MRAAWAVVILVAGCGNRPVQESDHCSPRSGMVVPFIGQIDQAMLVGQTLYFSDGVSISRVSLLGGPVEKLVEHYAASWSTGGGVLAWHTDHSQPPPGPVGAQLHIRDQAGVDHDLPPFAGLPYVLEVDTAGNVFWQVEDTDGVTRWDAVTHQQTTFPSARVDFFDDSRLYWVKDGLVWTMDSTGNVAQLSADKSVSGWSLMAADTDAIYLSPTNGFPTIQPASPIWVQRIAKSGAKEFTVAKDTVPYFPSHWKSVVDDTDLYWLSVPVGTATLVSTEVDLVRAPKDGNGVTEQVAVGDTKLFGVLADACNVYAVTAAGLVSYSHR